MKRVLIVDDDQDFLSVLEDVLRGEGYAVFCAVDGMEALSEFQIVEPNIVLLDNNMPNMTGIETLRAIRSLNSQVPVIMITALLDDGLISVAREYGANDFIAKPPNFPQMVEVIRDALMSRPQAHIRAI